MDIESDLKRALRRESPAPGFSQRVMANAGRAAEPVRVRPTWRAIAAGVVLTAIVGGWAAHQEIRRREGERARDEVMLALRIAGSKVRTAQEHVRQIGNR